MGTNYNLSGKSVLIADDDDSSYKYLFFLLSKTGAKIYRAVNGLRALAEVLKNPDIGLVLMDLNMPVLNGLDGTRLIKKYRPNVKIIAQTAHVYPSDIKKCIIAGCDDYMAKPIIPEQILSKISNIFSLSQTSSNEMQGLKFHPYFEPSFIQN